MEKFFLMSTLIRIIFLGLIVLVLSVVYNQVTPQGIRYQKLLPENLLIPAEHKEKMQVISADSAFIILNTKEAKFLDIRPAEDYELDHIPGAHHFPFEELYKKNISNKFDPKSKWVIYDESGQMKKMRMVASALLKKGAIEIYLLDGGYLSWLNRDYPVEMGEIL